MTYRGSPRFFRVQNQWGVLGLHHLQTCVCVGGGSMLALILSSLCGHIFFPEFGHGIKFIITLISLLHLFFLQHVFFIKSIKDKIKMLP